MREERTRFIISKPVYRSTEILRLPQGQRPFHLSSAIGHLCCRNSIGCKSSHACFAPWSKWPLQLTSATYSQDQLGTSLPGLVHTFNPVAHWFASGPVARSNAPFLSARTLHYVGNHGNGTITRSVLQLASSHRSERTVACRNPVLILDALHGFLATPWSSKIDGDPLAH